MNSENIVLKSSLGKPAVKEDEFFGRKDELRSLEK